MLLETITRAGIASIGIVGSDGVGNLDAYVEEGKRIDQFAVLAIRLHDRRKDTLKRETVTCVGEHDEALGIAASGCIFG